ncbi:MAG: PadR family transcriptional regulator [Gaiellaceae bacterium MAG52_C11]|nr:PadR family transcriptional regulator [Candidatus Gaiellasilicea maunaloa]
MPIQHAVLALLADGPGYGYELREQFQESVGPQWGELNIGHLYQVLDRLVRDGQIKRKVVPQTNRPDKNVYTLTGSGREELEQWLRTPFVRQSGYRDDFFLKLFAAARLGEEWIEQVTRVQREAYLSELSSLGELRARHDDDPLIRLLIEAAVLHTEANLRVVEQAAAASAELAIAHSASEALEPLTAPESARTVG